MFIQTEETPNPATLKFLPGKVVLPEGTREFRAAEEAEVSRVISNLAPPPPSRRVGFLGTTSSPSKDVAMPNTSRVIGAIMENTYPVRRSWWGFGGNADDRTMTSRSETLRSSRVIETAGDRRRQ